MIQSEAGDKCRHSKALPVDCCAFCVSSTPETLGDLCFDYIINNLDTICNVVDPFTNNLQLKPSVTLPVETCERLLQLRLSKTPRINASFIEIFKNQQATRLKRVRLRNTDLDDASLEVLLKHSLLELDISQCCKVSTEFLQLLTRHSHNLRVLSICECPNIFQYPPSRPGHIFLAPNLRKLSIRNLEISDAGFYRSLLAPLTHLTHLDLSNCRDLGQLRCVSHLHDLTSLVLYNVRGLPACLDNICKLPNLRHLDLSQSSTEVNNARYELPSKVLARLVECLPRLTSLDISGTNLAGTGVAEVSTVMEEEKMMEEEEEEGVGVGVVWGKMEGVTQRREVVRVSDVPGLSARVNNPFHFLGLYETQHDACLRHDIPAKLIAGNANEEQILVAALAYLDRTEMLQKVLNELFHLFRYESCEHVGQALNIVLEAMNRHLTERHIQISGSATLFYIVKGSGTELHDVIRVKRRIITALLNGMSEHRYDDTMMRNGCLTLCQFKIPWDVIFDYERLVEILLHSVYGMNQENFVQRIGIYLLNSLACQVDGQQKVKLGELGAINKMLWLISDRLDRRICDDVLEVAWSTMWNVTDETPLNCKKFLESKGMEYFLKCLECFPDKEELLRNMMGLLGNVAEVSALRHHLKTPEYLKVFAGLLESPSDGIEVSYNAAGVLSHIASDGEAAWTVEEPSREYVLERMGAAIDRWDLNSQRNINYRSFEPILYLVGKAETPQCQRWAVWALANLTTVYANKYCDLVEKEGGLVLLQQIIVDPLAPTTLKTLALIVKTNCRIFKSTHLDG